MVLVHLYIAIVECLAFKQMGVSWDVVVKAGNLDLGDDLAALKIKLSDANTLSHLEDTSGILQKLSAQRNERLGQGFSESLSEEDTPPVIELAGQEIKEQLTGAKFNFADPITFHVSQFPFHIPQLLFNHGN